MNLKKWFSTEETDILNDNLNEQYYNLKASEAISEDGSTKLVLLEPRAFSETQQIADQLKNRNTVVVNLKRVTSDQAKRIVDFLSGTIYAIGGDLQKVGGGIFLCTPNNVKVNGKITDDTEGKEIHDNGDINIEW
mgnify:CR=1 FL=1